METAADTVHREPWNKGKIVGQKAPFKVKDDRKQASKSRSESGSGELFGAEQDGSSGT